MNFEKMYLFAYGSLKKHFYNEDYLLEAFYIDKCVTADAFTMVKTDSEPFPFLLDNHNSSACKIKGELYEIDHEILEKLDKLEGYPNLYTRRTIKVVANDAVYETIAYFLKDSNILNNKKTVQIDEWTSEHEYEIISKNLLERLRGVIGEEENTSRS